MSRCEARLNVTSSSSSRIWPEEGSSRPAIILRVVVSPQPEGPSITKKSPSSIPNEEPRTAWKSPKRFCTFSRRIAAIALFRKVAGDEEGERSGEDHRERAGLEIE